MQKIVITAPAEKDLDNIYNFIAEDSKTNAQKFIAELQQTILKLKDFPDMGSKSKYKELAANNIRILIHKNYLIFYRTDEKFIYIMRILNGAANYKNLF